MPRTAGSQNQENLKYQKLYNWGRTLITSGVIKNQDKFPSEHILQKKFGYSRADGAKCFGPSGKGWTESSA